MKVMSYYNKFLKVHELLKKYNCKSTYDFEKEFQEPATFGGFNFYEPESEMHNDNHKKEYEEIVDATLDVCIPVKWTQAENNKMRFDIDYSDKAKLYSMYISLPTSSRSKSLSLKTYKKESELISEIEKFIKLSGTKITKTKNNIKKISVEKNQMDLFDFVN